MKYFIFDMDDTLYLRSEPFVRACIQCFPESAGWDPEKLYLTRKKHSDFSYDEYIAGRMSKDDMYIYRTAETFLEYNISLTPEEALAFEEQYSRMQGEIRLQPGMKACLQFLKNAGAPMFVITNGPAKRQRSKLQALDITSYIPETHWLISGEIGIDKPDPRIFQHAVQSFGISAEEAWYIGDSFEADVVGAFRAGWHSIWLNHRLESAGNGAFADYTVTSCEALNQLFQALFRAETGK